MILMYFWSEFKNLVTSMLFINLCGEKNRKFFKTCIFFGCGIGGKLTRLNNRKIIIRRRENILLLRQVNRQQTHFCVLRLTFFILKFHIKNSILNFSYFNKYEFFYILALFFFYFMLLNSTWRKFSNKKKQLKPRKKT